MSDDIVIRLRGQRTNSVLCEQAADEIERLRADNDSLHRAVSEQNRLNRLTNIAGQQVSEVASEAERQKAIAKTLYTALIQMKRRRGIHIDDANAVLDAIELWEEANA